MVADWELEPFRPAAWLPNGHLQSIAGRYLRAPDRQRLAVRRIELPDGDFLDLHDPQLELPDTAPVALILHGLEGSWASNYVVEMAAQLARLGVRPVRMNFRGCSGELNRLPRFYHAGETEDVRSALRWVRDRWPRAQVGAVGFSLGGNMLLKLLGEDPDAASGMLRAAVAISVPFDLSAGTRQLEAGGMSHLYTHYFIRKLRRKARGKQALLADHCDIDGALRARTIRAYDDRLTALLHGFEDAWDYYRRNSASAFLSEVALPTLVLHALDDPFLPPDSVPLREIRANPFLVDGVTEKGGHVGFIAGPAWRPDFWAEREAARFLASLLTA